MSASSWGFKSPLRHHTIYPANCSIVPYLASNMSTAGSEALSLVTTIVTTRATNFRPEGKAMATEETKQITVTRDGNKDLVLKWRGLFHH